MQPAVWLATSMVGSFPQPDWLIDRQALTRAKVPRLRMPSIWRVAPDLLAEAQDDATAAVIAEQERIGIDIVTDGEIRRESYSNLFANSLAGIDPTRTGTVSTGDGTVIPVPLFSGPVRRTGPVETAHVAFLRAHTRRRIKATLPGPFTMSEQAETTHYRDRRGLALDLADAVNAEIKDLFAAGADVVQLDEPWMQRWPERARQYGVEVVNRAVEGVGGTVALHICFGYGQVVSPDKPSRYEFLGELDASAVHQVSIEAAQPRLDLDQLRLLPSKVIILGVLDLYDERVEQPETVAARIRSALERVPPERLIIAPDCGMKYLSRQVARGKLEAMVAGTQLVRDQLN